MKRIALLTLTAASLVLAACGSTFTQRDAVILGTQIATDSLAVASRAVAGEKVDLNKETARIGLEAASTAVTLVGANLTADPATAVQTPDSVLNSAAAIAQGRIAAADPALAAAASQVATQAVDAAGNHLATAGAILNP